MNFSSFRPVDGGEEFDRIDEAANNINNCFNNNDFTNNSFSTNTRVLDSDILSTRPLAPKPSSPAPLPIQYQPVLRMYDVILAPT